MAVVFVPKALTGPSWHLIELGGGDSIEIAIARPTLEEQLQAVELARGLSWTAYELAAQIKDWRGVSDPDGNPVPYSWAALNQLCQAYDGAVFSVLAAVKKAKAPLDEDSLKNLPLPPVVGGTETATETIASTESSTSISNSSDCGVSAESST